MAQGEQRPVPSCSWVFDWGSTLGVGGGWAGSTRAACDEKQKRLSAGACPSSQGRGGDCRACACPRQTFRGTLPLSIVSGGGGCSGGSCLQAHTDAHERALTLVMGQLWPCGHTNLPRPQHPSWCGHALSGNHLPRAFWSPQQAPSASWRACSHQGQTRRGWRSP